MSGLSGSELLAVLIVVVLCIALAAVGLWVMRRLRQRREQLRGELSGSREAASDRAFNRIAMARREADVLARQGQEVSRARELIGSAQAAFDTRQFDRAYELSQSAHETLVAARLRPTPPAGSAPLPTGGSGAPAAPPAPKIPTHQAEAQFQIHLLSSEIDASRAAPVTAGRRREAETTLAGAQAAFDRADYSAAFRLALKGRREFGATVETVASGPTTPGGRGAPSDDPSSAAEALAAADRCPNCGHPTSANDPFCPGCGVPRVATA